MVTRWMPLTLGAAALAIIGIIAAPGAAAAEPGIAAQLSVSFGAGQPRLKLGIGTHKERPATQPGPLRPLAFRPVVELSARFSTSHRRIENLRLNGLPFGKRALYTNEGEEENGDGASGGNGGKVALAIAGVAAGVLIFGYLVAEDITDDVLDAIEGA